MKNIILLISLVYLSFGCATARTRSSDPVMRVAIDADSISRAAYVRIQNALMESGKFVVVDRAMGFRAIAKEQEMQHETTRFGDNEKYALWGKMYGVGGIIVATLQCGVVTSGWTHQNYNDCIENLSLINATTGEVMAVSEEHVETAQYNAVSPEWTAAVDAMIENYPKTFIDKHDPNRTINYSNSLVEYREKTVPQNRKPAQDQSDLSDRIQ